MMDNALEVRDLTKKYTDFTLDHISFHVPYGSIVGFIGKNGAGKSTTIKTILNLNKKEAGTISILGNTEQAITSPVREQVGIVFDGENFPEKLSPNKLKKLFKCIYPSWDDVAFYSLLKQLSIPMNKKIKHFSKGMKMKLAIAATLSHHPKLLILDEPTSGLDPIVRDDILDLLMDFVQDERKSILVSSHITSDLEKIADYIVFIHNGKVIFQKAKDELIYQYGVMKCGAEQFHALDKSDMIGYRKQDFEWQVLVFDKESAQKKYPNAVIDSATIDEIMLFYVKGESK